MKLYGAQSYFTTQEFACKCGCGFGSQESDISEKLIRYLNEVRKLYGNPMTVNSGARCTTYNASIGGKPNSAHLPNPSTHQCEAVDISISGGNQRYLLMKMGIYSGFRRLGLADDFIHFDVAQHLPEEVIWVY